MKKLGFVFAMLVIALIASGSAVAQNVGDNSVYFVTYYSNANTTGAPDATVRIVNDGDASTAEVEGVPNGNLWASFYVFDDSQELQQCCNCFISADGLLSESINHELRNLGNDLTGRAEPNRGVIKVIASSGDDPTNNTPAAGLHGWATHIQAASTIYSSTKKANTISGPYYVTETALADANLVAAEQTALQDSCSFAFTLGSGYGHCQCTPEDYDF